MILEELRQELGVYNKTINNYSKTFDLNFNTPQYVVRPTLYGIRDYQEITKKLITKLRKDREVLLKYEKDYYEHKTITAISIKLKVDIPILIDFCNKRLSTFQILHQGKENQDNAVNNIKLMDGEHEYCNYNNRGIIDENTKLVKISSYEIMKQIHLENLQNRIKSNSQ